MSMCCLRELPKDACKGPQFPFEPRNYVTNHSTLPLIWEGSPSSSRCSPSGTLPPTWGSDLFSTCDIPVVGAGKRRELYKGTGHSEQQRLTLRVSVNISFSCIPFSTFIFSWSKSTFHPDSRMRNNEESSHTPSSHS